VTLAKEARPDRLCHRIFVPPNICYAVSRLVFGMDAHLVCPWCPNITMFSSAANHRQVGLTIGLASGILFGAASAISGCALQRIVSKSRAPGHLKQKPVIAGPNGKARWIRCAHYDRAAILIGSRFGQFPSALLKSMFCVIKFKLI
jgi:hypothetical protein